MITQSRLKELLDYNPETGRFTWKVDRGPVKKGFSSDYKQIHLGDKLYTKKKLANLYMYGTPIDDINTYYPKTSKVFPLCYKLEIG
jgi:hypothetical protein